MTWPAGPPGEYRRELAEARPEAAEPFGRATDLFERAWYADEPVDADDLAEMRRLDGEVFAGRSRRRVGA